VKAGAKTPWVLAAVAALLGLYILVFERRHETTDEARAEREHLFAGLNRGDITAIEIDRGAKGRVTLTRDSSAAANDAWRVDPGRAPAASGAVGDVLDAIDGLDVDRVASATLASAGLEPPSVHLIITAARRFALDVGGPDASGRGAFVRRDGDPRIFVVGQRLRELVDRDAGAFRDRGLFAAASVDGATTLVFRSEGGPPRTLRKRAGLWLDEQGTFATRTAVGEVLRMLVALRASGFSDPPPANGGDPPGGHRTIEVTGDTRGAHTSARLEVWANACPGDGGASGQLAVYTATTKAESERSTREGICLDRGAVDRLWRQLEAANRRDPHLLTVDPVPVDGVVLSEGAHRLRLHRNDDGGWHFVEPRVDYEADAKVVSEWLAKLAATTLEDGALPAHGGGSRPSRHLVVEGPARAEIEIAPPRGAQAWVSRAGESAPALVGAAAFAALEPEPLHFRSRAVLALPQFDVRALEIRGRRSHIRLRREAGAEWIRDGEGAPPNASAVDHLLSILSDLRAEEFPTPQPASFEAETTVDVEVRSGEAPAQHNRVELAAKCRARADGTPVFTLPAKSCADIQHTLAGVQITAKAPRTPSPDSR
jgi:hypothetical protein